MSGHTITKPLQPRHDDLCADLIGVLRQLAESLETGLEPPTFVRCAGCGSTERDDMPCRVCAAMRKGRR